jgi:hypothetical protein
VKALVLNALGGGFDFEDVDIAAPVGREALIDVQASHDTEEEAIRIATTPDMAFTPASSEKTFSVRAGLPRRFGPGAS